MRFEDDIGSGQNEVDEPPKEDILMKAASLWAGECFSSHSQARSTRVGCVDYPTSALLTATAVMGWGWACPHFYRHAAFPPKDQLTLESSFKPPIFLWTHFGFYKKTKPLKCCLSFFYPLVPTQFCRYDNNSTKPHPSIWPLLPLISSATLERSSTADGKKEEGKLNG